MPLFEGHILKSIAKPVVGSRPSPALVGLASLVDGFPWDRQVSGRSRLLISLRVRNTQIQSGRVITPLAERHELLLGDIYNRTCQ